MIKEKYVNLFTDFGFKRVFGQEAHKDVLIDFLNAVLPEDYQIRELSFSKNEALGESVVDRKAIFDLHCISAKGERFIVELQKAKQQFFKERSLFYATFPITEQAKRGEWNYRLDPVFLVGILNFSFEDSRSEEIRHHIQLKDQHCEVFYEKLHFIYLEVVKFKKSLQDCSNRFEKWLWIFKNLPEMDEIPEGLMDNMLAKVFKIAEVAGMNSAEREAYQDSLKYMRDLHSVVETAYIEGREEGREEGRVLGLQYAVCRLREQGMADGEIAELLELTAEDLRSIDCDKL